jgi:predicted alpha/beta-fold hydrolase
VRYAGGVDVLAGHFWTIAPVLRHRFWPAPAPPAEAWSTTVQDARVGPVTLRGVFRDLPGSDGVVLVVHGLGGTTQTHYCVSAASAAEAAGLSCLRLALRGADRDGEDFYHAGQAEDVGAALASREIERFARVFVLGYSLGGHVVLRYALGPCDRRVQAVAAVCAPLDLEQGARHIDAPGAYVYRRHVLSGLKAMYAEVARRRPVPVPVAHALAARTIRQWDELTVVPRYGFGSAERYYATMSVGPRLAELAVPALLVQHRADPMVPEWSYRQHLEAPPARLALRWLPAGGHVGYPRGIDLGEPGTLGVEPQVLAWLARHE